ncbi:hypothetical protein HON01_11985, partial [Candidatus Woesearchaeota archaeon]|nr:hypothetical protein [Candidatus Woesearchaeota archaeon]
NLFLIPLFGIVGAAISTTISFLIMFVISCIILKRLKFNIKFNNWFKIIIINIGLYLEIVLLRSVLHFHIYFKIFLILLIIAVSYFAAAYFLKIVDFKEIKKLMSFRQ